MSKRTQTVETIRCDRCGTVIENAEPSVKDKWTRIHAQALNSGAVVLPSGKSDGGYATDLCGKCSNSFLEWYNQ